MNKFEIVFNAVISVVGPAAALTLVYLLTGSFWAVAAALAIVAAFWVGRAIGYTEATIEGVAALRNLKHDTTTK